MATLGSKQVVEADPSGLSRLLQEVTGLIRAQENRQLKTVGIVFVS
jgi:hypothetical protein